MLFMFAIIDDQLTNTWHNHNIPFIYIHSIAAVDTELRIRDSNQNLTRFRSFLSLSFAAYRLSAFILSFLALIKFVDFKMRLERSR